MAMEPNQKRRKIGIGKSSSSEDPFLKLPNEVVGVIFSKLPTDLRFLCHCSLVSKLFRSAFRLVPSVSITIPLTNCHRDQLIAHPDARFENALHSLRNFDQIRSLTIHLDEKDDSFGKTRKRCYWKANFDTRIESFLFLSFRQSVGHVECNEVGEDEDHIISWLERACVCTRALNSLGDLKGNHRFLLNLIQNRQLPLSLDSVVVTDSKHPGGKLCVRGERLVNLRNDVLTAKTMGTLPIVGDKDGSLNKLVYVPVLHLPSSGYVMKKVTLVGFGTPGNDVEAMKEWEYNEDDDSFKEAVMLLLTKRN